MIARGVGGGGGHRRGGFIRFSCRHRYLATIAATLTIADQLVTSSSGGGSSIGRCSQWQVNVNDVDSSSAAVLDVVVREAAVAAAVAAAGAVKGWKLRVE